MKDGEEMKAEIDELDREILSRTPEGRIYLEYNEKVGGEPWGEGIGIPQYEEKYKTLVDMYRDCIRQNKTWEELLGYQNPMKDNQSAII